MVSVERRKPVNYFKGKRSVILCLTHLKGNTCTFCDFLRQVNLMQGFHRLIILCFAPGLSFPIYIYIYILSFTKIHVALTKNHQPSLEFNSPTPEKAFKVKPQTFNVSKHSNPSCIYCILGREGQETGVLKAIYSCLLEADGIVTQISGWIYVIQFSSSHSSLMRIKAL